VEQEGILVATVQLAATPVDREATNRPKVENRLNIFDKKVQY
jgi:hypothetical protein